MSRTQHVAVIGLGDFGTALALELTAFGDHVLGIDKDESRVSVFGEQIDQVVQADASDIRALKELALSDFDAVAISIGNDMESSLITTMNALELGCKTIWVKAQGPMHERILRQLGISRIILPDQQAGKRIAERIHNPMLADFMGLSGNSFVARLVINDSLAGKYLRDTYLNTSDDLTCLGIERDGALQVLESVTLETGDNLIVYGDRRSMHKLRLSEK